MNKENDSITWLQFNNIVPIISSLIMTTLAVASIYFRLNAKLDLAIQKLDHVASLFNEHRQESISLSARMTENVKDRDEEISGIKQQIATIKAILKIQ